MAYKNTKIKHIWWQISYVDPRNPLPLLSSSAYTIQCSWKWFVLYIYILMCKLLFRSILWIAFILPFNANIYIFVIYINCWFTYVFPIYPILRFYLICVACRAHGSYLGRQTYVVLIKKRRKNKGYQNSNPGVPMNHLTMDLHYNDAIMSTMVSQITDLSIVCLTVCSGIDQRKHQNSASLAFVWGTHWSPVGSPHKGPVTRKKFSFDDVIMYHCSGSIHSPVV